MPRGIINDQLKEGTYWICKSAFNVLVQPTDIFAKILKVGEDKVYIMRKSKFGYEDLQPISMDITEFLSFYFRLED